MTGPGPPREGPLMPERERVVQRLSEAFAADQIPLDQLESRLALVWSAESPSELERLVADLPAPATTPAVSQRAAVARKPEKAKTLVAVLGGVARRGSWEVPPALNAIAFMGGVEIDLRDAVLTSDVVEINAVAIMGAVEVIVPPGVRLDSDGLALLGGFEDQLTTPASAPTGAPTVRIRGFALMGGVEAKVLEPGAANED